MSSSSIAQYRNHGLDVLRGIAIVFVIIHHLALSFRLPLLIVLITVLTVLHLAGFKDYLIDKQGQSLGGAIFAALGLHINLYESRHGYLPGSWDVLWSLSIEELFYILFPIACVLLRSWLMPLVLFLLVVSLPYTLEAATKVNEIWGEKAYLPGMAAIALGVLGAQITNRFRLSPFLARALLLLGSIAFIGLVVYRGLLFRTWGQTAMLFYCLTCLMLIFACVNVYAASSNEAKQHAASRGWRALFAWPARIVAHLGRLSYELYLTHMFVVLGITALYRAYFPQQLYWAFAIYPVALLLCERLAYATQRWIGAPLGQRLLGALTKKHHAAEASQAVIKPSQH